MDADLEQRTRAEVVDAYASVTRLRVWMRLALITSVLFFLANLGGMVVGWLPVDVGVLGLLTAALTATISVAKSYESVHRTTLYAMDLERTLPGDEDLDSSSVSAQSLKTLSGIALAVAVVVGVGIVGYSVANAGTQQPITSLSQAFVPDEDRDDDDDDDGDDRDDDDGDDGGSDDSEDGSGDDADREQGDQQQNGTAEQQSDSGGDSSGDDNDNDSDDD